MCTCVCIQFNIHVGWECCNSSCESAQSNPINNRAWKEHGTAYRKPSWFQQDRMVATWFTSGSTGYYWNLCVCVHHTNKVHTCIQVLNAWSEGRRKEILTKVRYGTLSRDDILLLQPPAWLADKVNYTHTDGICCHSFVTSLPRSLTPSSMNLRASQQE